MSAQRLIIFTRYPQPGATKTRLIPALGAEGAADLQRQLTEKVVAEARQLRRGGGLDIEIRHAGGDAGSMAVWLGNDLRYADQGPGDLGRRMATAFADGFAAGAGAMVLVGSDIPALTEAVLAAAFEALGRADLVLGPAADGGYYLVGLRLPRPELFTGVAWGSAGVCAETLERAATAGLVTVLLEELRDVDRPEDLPLIGHPAGP